MSRLRLIIDATASQFYSKGTYSIEIVIARHVAPKNQKFNDIMAL